MAVAVLGSSWQDSHGMAHIFISHCSRDKELVDAIVDLLQTGCHLGVDEIFCTSIDGFGIKVGEDFVKWIQDHLEKAEVALLLLTPNYYSSNFCVAEMGAAWILKKGPIPLVAPNLPRDPGVVLLGTQSLGMGDTDWDRLRDRLAESFPKVAEHTDRWSVKKGEFLKRLPDILSSLPKPDVVAIEALEGERSKADAAQELYAEECQRTKELKELVAKLKETKDREEVTAVLAEELPDAEMFQELAHSARNALSEVGNIATRCLFARIRNDDWTPPS